MFEVQIQSDTHHASLSTGSYRILHDACVEDSPILKCQTGYFALLITSMCCCWIFGKCDTWNRSQKSYRCCTIVPECWYKFLMLLYSFALLRSRSAIARTKSLHCCLSSSFWKCWGKEQKILTLLVAAVPLYPALVPTLLVAAEPLYPAMVPTLLVAAVPLFRASVSAQTPIFSCYSVINFAEACKSGEILVFLTTQQRFESVLFGVRLV